MKTLFKIPDEKYGWIVTAAAMLLMAMAFGLLVSVSVFFGPLEAEFGWSRAAVSFAYSSAAFMSGLGGIFAGRLADRFPTRPILMVGVFSLGLAFLMLSLMQGLGLFYVGYAILVGGLGNACFLAPLMSNVGFWFRRNKGVAMGMVLAGQSLGAALLPYIIRHLIAGFGWRQTYLMMAFAVWGLLFPAAFLVREPPLRSDGRVSLPESPGHHAVEKKLPAWLSPRALTMMLCAAIVFCCICMSIPVVHLFPLGLETGLAPERAALVLSVMMTTSIIGRVGVGRVADLIGGVPALMLASGGQTVMIYLFIVAGGGFEAMLLVAVGFGLAYGGVIPAYAIIIRETIPVRRVGGALGLVFFFGNTGMSLGGWLGGWLHDWSGAYPAAYVAGALGGVVNLILVGTLLLMLRRAAPQPASVPAA